MSPLLRDPDVAVAALLAGIVVGSVEFLRPGWVVPGAAGAAFLMLGVAGLSTQPVQPLGLALLVAAVALMCADVLGHWNGWGAAVAAGLAVAAIRFLVASRVSWPVAVFGGMTLLGAWRVLQFAVQAKANKAV